MLVSVEKIAEISSKTRTYQSRNGYKRWQVLPNRDENPRQEVQETLNRSTGGLVRGGIIGGGIRVGWVGVRWDVLGRGRWSFLARRRLRGGIGGVEKSFKK